MSLLGGFEFEFFIELLTLLLALAHLSFLLILGLIMVVSLKRKKLHSGESSRREEILRPTNLLEYHRALCVIIVLKLQKLREQIITLRRGWVDTKVSEVLHRPALGREIFAVFDSRLIVLGPEVFLVP
jgi:hypothetical protein